MSLPQGFTFSQSSLQDYLDCPRRFQLRYLLRIAWPALHSQPVQEHERLMRQGERFHRLAQQYFLGLPQDVLASQVKDTELAQWWESFLTHVPGMLGGLGDVLPDVRLQPEKSLVLPFAGFRLAAKYDLLVNLAPQKVLILDWKTGRKRQQRDHLASRVQTRLYPFLLSQAASRLNGSTRRSDASAQLNTDRARRSDASAHLNTGSTLPPERIEMAYWYAAFPSQPEHFVYDADQMESDRSELAAWISEIDGLDGDQFPLTTQLQRCKYCVYRSLCERGIAAGNISEADADDETGFELEPELDFDQIGEIQF